MRQKYVMRKSVSGLLALYILIVECVLAHGFISLSYDQTSVVLLPITGSSTYSGPRIATLPYIYISVSNIWLSLLVKHNVITAFLLTICVSQEISPESSADRTITGFCAATDTAVIVQLDETIADVPSLM